VAVDLSFIKYYVLMILVGGSECYAGDHRIY